MALLNEVLTKRLTTGVQLEHLPYIVQVISASFHVHDVIQNMIYCIV